MTVKCQWKNKHLIRYKKFENPIMNEGICAFLIYELSANLNHCHGKV